MKMYQYFAKGVVIMYRKILKKDNIPEKLLNLGERKYLKKNEIIVNSGDILDNIYILVKGKIVAMTISINGSLIYNNLLLPYYIIGETCINTEVE